MKKSAAPDDQSVAMMARAGEWEGRGGQEGEGRAGAGEGRKEEGRGGQGGGGAYHCSRRRMDGSTRRL